MTSTTSFIDYRNTAFEIATLTKIHGEPTFESIRKLQREININAQCVHSELGGGAHGHLGLVLTPQEYALHSNAAYRRPNHPGPLVIPPGTTQHMANTMREQHRERLRIFREVQGVDQALRQQIATAIEPQYLEAIRNTTTGRIALPVRDILRHLYSVYGRVTPQKLQDRESAVRQMVYDPVNPIDGIFTAIDELVQYADAANTPYTQAQIINLAYIIVNRTGHFRRWILSWNERDPVQKTWTNFKLHFREAHHQLRETTSLQQHQSSYQVNAVREFIDELKNELRSEAHVTTPPDDSSTTPSITGTSTFSNDSASTISALQTELTSLREMVHHMSSPDTPPPTWPMMHPPPYMPYHPMLCQQMGHQMAMPHQPPHQQSAPQKKRRIFYCWTHGAALHSGERCINRAPGHQASATFKNRMGGSTKNVRMPATQETPTSN